MYVSFPNYDRVSIHQTQYNALTAQLSLKNTLGKWWGMISGSHIFNPVQQG